MKNLSKIKRVLGYTILSCMVSIVFLFIYNNIFQNKGNLYGYVVIFAIVVLLVLGYLYVFFGLFEIAYNFLKIFQWKVVSITSVIFLAYLTTFCGSGEFVERLQSVLLSTLSGIAFFFAEKVTRFSARLLYPAIFFICIVEILLLIMFFEGHIPFLKKESISFFSSICGASLVGLVFTEKVEFSDSLGGVHKYYLSRTDLWRKR